MKTIQLVFLGPQLVFIQLPDPTEKNPYMKPNNSRNDKIIN